MRPLLPLLIIVAIPGCGTDLKEFSTDGKFTVLIAGKPKEESQSILGVTTKSWVVEDRNGVYGISVSDYAGGDKFIPEEIEARLKSVREILINGNKARVISESEVKLADKYPGRTIEAELTERDGLLRARYYLVNGRLYQVSAIGSKSWANSESVSRFLGSLRLKE